MYPKADGRSTANSSARPEATSSPKPSVAKVHIPVHNHTRAPPPRDRPSGTASAPQNFRSDERSSGGGFASASGRSSAGAGWEEQAPTAMAPVSRPVAPLDRRQQTSAMPTQGGTYPIVYHDAMNATGEPCQCPMCKLTQYISFLYSNQRRASPQILCSRPSAYSASLPELQPVMRPDFIRDWCPVFATYGFCPYNQCCYLSHTPTGRPPLVPRLGSAGEELNRLRSLEHEHACNELWSCAVCGFQGIGEASVAPVGETYYYRSCPQCSFMCYFPYITYLIDDLLSGVGDDYQAFKDGVDSYRRELPDEFKVPLTLEAHRQGSVIFAWSLLSPRDARDAAEAAVHALPEAQCIVSVGCGSGYIEHVFNRVVNNVPDAAKWDVNRKLFPTSSFHGVRASFCGRLSLQFRCFEEIVLRNVYSVKVAQGGPPSILTVNCPRSVLLLCWPPFGSPQDEQSSMGFEALETYTTAGGQVVIFIGDVASTGDWRFHQMLFTHYKLVPEYPVRRELRRWCPQEMGLVYAGNDTIGVYKRRPQPIPLPLYWSCSM